MKVRKRKIILSRKGFDSRSGGIVSPIFEDGTLEWVKNIIRD